MIKYFFNHFFHLRVRIIILIVIFLITGLAFAMASPFTNQAELYLDFKQYNINYYHKMYLIIKYILMFTISLVLIDHDAIFLKPLISYFGRTKISVIKLFFYCFVLLWLITIIFAITLLIPFLFTPYFAFDSNNFIDYLKLIPDSIIMCLLLLIIVRDNRKSLGFLLLIFIVVITFIQEDSNYFWIIYLLPLSNSLIYESTLGLYYLIGYIVLLIWFYSLVFHRENI